ncbi:hypothetical protein A1E_05075 [Rickettsia canadensis str. McKiel]|uniref:Uncharacterized protein n=1 Tax=Rickettsia canadensis (strain McKiel) TaxID=293613 RepID=A8EZZ8_RICCK|nr:hypothetical protein [Rickettsia canadensis]ABV73931.1 hypothetical protein A1E_05075 [Rickettsia canadensis str. McKiel]
MDALLKIDYVRFESTTISPELYENILNNKKVIYVKNKHKPKEVLKEVNVGIIND